jgi:hypothetical protein
MIKQELLEVLHHAVYSLIYLLLHLTGPALKSFYIDCVLHKLLEDSLLALEVSLCAMIAMI